MGWESFRDRIDLYVVIRKESKYETIESCHLTAESARREIMKLKSLEAYKDTEYEIKEVELKR